MPESNTVSARNLSDDLNLIRDAAAEAGDIAMRHFGRDPEVWMKTGRSPVSEADIAVDRFLRKTLRGARPDYGWLSEESDRHGSESTNQRTFVVDPIDGTRAFLAGKDIWCVSIAIVEQGVPVVGVLDCPVRKEVYRAYAGSGAACNGAAITVRMPSSAPIVGGPPSMIRSVPTQLREMLVEGRYVPSLAYRIAMVASGELDATFVKPNAHDWDVAAADIILAEAGGIVLDATGKPPYYAGRDPRLGALAAGSGSLIEDMAAVLAAVEI